MKHSHIILIAFALFSGSAAAQTVEVGFEPFMGPTSTVSFKGFSLSSSFEMWKPGPVNEYANNVPVEGGFQTQIGWSSSPLRSGRFSPFFGVAFRKTFERIGNKSALFKEYYKPYGEHFVYNPLKGRSRTSDVDPEAAGRHPGYIRDDSFRGQYSYLGPVVGIVYQANRFVYLRGSFCYLPLLASATVEDRFNGSFNYSDLRHPWFVNLGVTIDMLGDR